MIRYPLLRIAVLIDASFNCCSAGAFDFTSFHALQHIRRITGQAAKQVSLGFAAMLSRGSVRTSIFILPAVTDFAVASRGDLIISTFLLPAVSDLTMRC